jgi:hypothetical protein
MSDNIWDEFEKSNVNTDGTPGAVSIKDKRIEFNKPSTQIRLLSNKDGLKRMFHFIRTAGSKGRSVVCCGKDCPVCAVGDIPQPKWLMVAMERETLRVGVVQLTRGMMKGIAALRKLPPFGPDVTSYDLLIIKNIERNKEGKEQTSYMVHGLPQGTVPAVDDATRARIISEAKEITEHIEDFAKIYSPDQTLRYLGWSTSPAPSAQSSAAMGAGTRPMTSPPSVHPASSVSPPVVQSPQASSSKTSNFDISSFLTKPELEADATYKVDPKIAAAAPATESEDGDIPQFNL